MSTRDEGVRKLAEEIAEMSRAWGTAPAGNVEDKITNLLAEREAALQAQLARALGEGAGLREELRTLVAHCEEMDWPEHILADARAALTSSPLARQAGALIRSALAAPATLRHWADRAESVGAEARMVAMVRNGAGEMVDWQRVHGYQVPDLPKETP